MSWDLAEKPYLIELQVQADEIDALGHANNAVYVSWLERCAWSHSQSLGLDLAEYQRLDRAMAIIRHEVDGVLVPVGDEGAFTSAMLRLAEDEAELQRLAAGCPAILGRLAESTVQPLWAQVLSQKR